MDEFDRITVEPGKMGGQPCIRGMRLTVRRVLIALTLYHDREELRRQYPEIEDEDIRQCLLFAAASRRGTPVSSALPWRPTGKSWNWRAGQATRS
jgi:uncharacterized protein (DUF433 family)